MNIFAATITLGIAIYSIITGNNPHAAQQDGCSAKLISNFLVVSGIIDIMISLSLYLNPGLEIARWFNLSPNTERIIEKWEDFSVICNMNVFIRILFNFTSLVLVIAAASLLWSANCVRNFISHLFDTFNRDQLMFLSTLRRAHF